jgi:hypothetical protein
MLDKTDGTLIRYENEKSYPFKHLEILNLEDVSQLIF